MIIITMVDMGYTAALGIATAAILMVFLATKELSHARGSNFPSHIAKFLDVAIIPLTIAFAVTLAIKIAEVL